jgi:hypothetical protein
MLQFGKPGDKAADSVEREIGTTPFGGKMVAKWLFYIHPVTTLYGMTLVVPTPLRTPPPATHSGHAISVLVSSSCRQRRPLMIRQSIKHRVFSNPA